MKKYIIHLAPFIISLIWLVAECQTFNPIFLKGPEFLTFYLILLLGFYASVFGLRVFQETVHLWFRGFKTDQGNNAG